MSAPDASSWARLKAGDDRTTCYSRTRLCEMNWTLEAPLGKCMSAVMPAGGPIALLNGDGTTPGARLQLFSGTGELLSAWEWEHGKVRALGWTPDVELVCVLESGRVMLWNLRGARCADFALGEAIDHQGVLECRTFSDGFAVLTSAYRIFVLLSYTQRSLIALPDPRLASPPTAMAVLERDNNGGSSGDGGGGGAAAPGLLPRCPQVLLATASRTILSVDESDVHDHLLATGPFLHLEPSPNGMEEQRRGQRREGA